MNADKKKLLLEAWAYCDEHDKSTEFMLQYMSDTSKVPYQRVVDYIYSKQSTKDREEYCKFINGKVS